MILKKILNFFLFLIGCLIIGVLSLLVWGGFIGIVLGAALIVIGLIGSFYNQGWAFIFLDKGVPLFFSCLLIMLFIFFFIMIDNFFRT